MAMRVFHSFTGHFQGFADHVASVTIDSQLVTRAAVAQAASNPDQ